MNKKPKDILFLTTHFPPVNVSGVHRIIGFLRYLPENNYKLTVLTIKNILDAPLDNNLINLVPNYVKIVRIPFPEFNLFSKKRAKNKKSNIEKNFELKNTLKSEIKKHIKRIIYFPDRFWPWIFSVISYARKKTYRPDCIITTAPPFSTLLIGLILSKYWQIPLISDFRDPWSLNPFNIESYISTKLQQKMEHYIIKKSRFIIVNTEEALEAYIKKYKKYKDKIICIPNGFDNYKLPNKLPDPQKNEKEKIHITHCGSLYGLRNPLPLLEALSKSFVDSPFIFSFYGYINPHFLKNFVKNKGFNSIVKIHKTVSYIDSLKIMHSSDIILIYGNCSPNSLQIPRKIYDVLNINKPILLIDTKNSSSYKLLKKLGVPFFFSENTYSGIMATLNRILEVKKQKNLYQYCYRPATIHQFHIKNLTKRLEILLEKI